MSTITAILAAALPTAVYSLLLWWLDRYEKEPLPLILAAFLWGALPAIALAVLFELVLATPLERSPLGPGVAVWGLAPLVEEPVKGLALVGLFYFARQEFDGPLDGIVYGALIGFGFSMTENLLYFLRYTSDDTLFWVRGVIFGMNHAFFTSMIGLALGAVRYSHSRRRSVLALLGGLALAILFHALHNFAVRYQFPGLLLSWLIESGGVLVVLAVAALAWRRERRWIEEELGEEVRAGVLTARDYAEITSPPLRVRRQVAALLAGGWLRYRQVRRLHHLATKLAFRKSQARLDDDCHPADACERLRHEIVVLRTALRGEESAWSEY
ncbi:MAG: PrsW family intramembrane metalloprotease [Roseiflexaceae bacterium]